MNLTNKVALITDASSGIGSGHISMKLFLFGFLFMTVATVMGQSEPGPKRLLVVSGGGARGAWGVGIANFLDSTGKRYAHVVGTSTGSLMAPLILLRRFDDLNRAYTSVTQKDIFNINPFNRNGGIRILNVLCRFNKPSLGTTDNLRELIRRFVTPADYNQIRTSNGLDFTVAVTNLRTLEPAYQSASQNSNYEQMVNWIWASANQPVFMSPYIVKNENGVEDFWVDGGVRNPIAIQRGLLTAIDKGYEAVDVIVNGLPSADEPESSWPDGKATIFKSLTRTLNAYGSGTRDMNITIGRLLDELNRLQAQLPVTLAASGSQAVAVADESGPGIVLTFYFMPKNLFKLIPNELLFNPDQMRTLLEAGRRGEYVRPVQPAAVTERIEVAGSYSFNLSRTALRQLLNKLNF